MVKPQPESPTRGEPSGGSSKYKGVRKRKWGKWVSEIRLPNSRERIWLGSYDSPEKAARAFDAAQYCLRGSGVKLNFPDNPPDMAGARSLSPLEIQAFASRYANESSFNDNNNVGITNSNHRRFTKSSTMISTASAIMRRFFGTSKGKNISFSPPYFFFSEYTIEVAGLSGIWRILSATFVISPQAIYVSDSNGEARFFF
ncbi:ERF017 protein [Hibiscus syriacus]|uniref:ERF017 protein n=1 Tax=Hibiscus syriacus TaxID=106335 RepID=A0A6A3B993_HIBSY|nr:ethylene-responsive transcription factor ERF017-like [Hibiscus syriacus]KAE8712517.1 ERF017 protein [Hibiscus syriacus]